VGLLSIFFVNFKLLQLILQLFTQNDVLQDYKRQSTSGGGGRSVEQGSMIRSTFKNGQRKAAALQFGAFVHHSNGERSM
jgi:hypothetical protein